MPGRKPIGASVFGQVPNSIGLYATASQLSAVYAVGMVLVRLLSNTETIRLVMLESDAGSVPVNALRLRSSIVSDVKPRVLFVYIVQFCPGPLCDASGTLSC